MKKENIVYTMIYLYVILTPFYIFNSGLPQISDFIMLFAILYYFSSIKKIQLNSKLIINIFIIIFYIVIINGYWFSKYQSNDFIISTLFYLFNFMILIYFISIHTNYGSRVLKHLYKALCISLILQFILSLFYSSAIEGREYLLFNNPNQLGYFVILTIALIMFISFRIKPKSYYLIIIHIIAIYLAILSLSKSAIILTSILFLFQIILFYLNIFNIKRIIILSSFIFIIIGVVFLNAEEIRKLHTYQEVESRISTLNLDSTSNLEERRYDRVFENKKYWFLGAGEGATHKRFQSGEIHSTFFNIFFNYGIVGTVLFLFLFVYLIKNSRWEELILLFIIFIYGLTHNGIRQGFIWILIALIFAVNRKEKFNEKNSDILLWKSK